MSKLSKLKEEWKEWKWVIICLTVVVIAATVGIGIIIANDVAHENWYNSLTDEERAAYDAEQAAVREKNIYRYELLNVSQYLKNRTNKFGGVVGTDICYTFQYLDGDKVRTVQDFEDLEHGLTKLVIGDSNMYIVDTNGINTYRYLQLTRETLENIKLQQNTP